MKQKELHEIISKSKSPAIREMFTEMINRNDTKDNRKFASVLESLENDLENDLNFKAKAIAAYIRANMEDFHSKNLSDAQMKELNPLIRNAIYTFLVNESERNLIDISFCCALNLAPYWEDCEYMYSTSNNDENC